MHRKENLNSTLKIQIGKKNELNDDDHFLSTVSEHADGIQLNQRYVNTSFATCAFATVAKY
jgi:hypothetical protein